ncbi:hypothetical protein [Leptolyngbya sp. CCY15150]|nr:hypothetical protein [Leptolyngbya sp. CCY15150]
MFTNIQISPGNLGEFPSSSQTIGYPHSEELPLRYRMLWAVVGDRL